MAKKTCISPEQKAELDKAIARGDFSLEKIQKTKSSAERFELVNKHFDNEEVSKKVVRDIESRLSSKKEEILNDYMKRNFSDVPVETRKGVLNKFKRMQGLLGAKEEKDFMEELVAHKFGAYITKDEANKLEKLTTEAVTLREKIPVKAEDMTDESLAYGEKIVELENLESVLYMQKTEFKLADIKKLKGQKGTELSSNFFKYLLEATGELSGATRAFKATADVSGLLRQNWKIASGAVGELGLNTLKGNPTKENVKFRIWKNSFWNTVKAVQETSKYGDHRFYDSVRAEIHAHPNSYNGVFDVASNQYGLRAGVEEQFPSSIPSDAYDKYTKKAGINGDRLNVFKISEVAFNAVVLKARFELANDTIKVLKGIDGVNIMDKKYANPAGEFVSGFTGRGGLFGLETGKGSDLFNKILFAPRYMASQFSPYFQIAKGATTHLDNPAATLAASQNIQFLVGSAALMMTAETLRALVENEDPDYTSVMDPRSNSFGKFKVPFTDRSIDLTGGNRSVWSLMAALGSKKFYDARLGIWREKGFFQTVDGKPYYDFISGKYAPVPGVVRDMIRGEMFGGEDLTLSLEGGWNVTKSLLLPITVENVWEEAVDKDEDMLGTAGLVMVAELVGLGTTDIRFKPQNDEWSALLNTDKKAYWRAVDEAWDIIQGEVETLQKDEDFQALSKDKQAKKMEKMYNRALDRVIGQTKYKEPSATKLKEIKDERKKSIL